jgi:hypothetical protein
MPNENEILLRKSQIERLEYFKVHLNKCISVKLNFSDISNTCHILKVDADGARQCQFEEITIEGLGELTDEFINNAKSMVELKINELENEIKQLQAVPNPQSL